MDASPFILLLLASCSHNRANIQEIDSFDQASAILDTADNNTLVVFDVDDTLIYPLDTVRQTWFRLSTQGQQFFKKLEEHAATKENPQEYMNWIKSKMHQAEVPLTVEPQTAEFIKGLQKRGIKVIALTNFSTGPMGIIASKQAWRLEKLALAGIDFSISFGNQEVALNLQTTTGRSPLFYKGILLTEHAEKGPVLGAFLDVVNYKPNHIICFDDKRKNIESVNDEARRRGIIYHGFVYKAAEKLPQNYDPTIVQLQLNYIIEHDDYITDEQARALLNK